VNVPRLPQYPLRKRTVPSYSDVSETYIFSRTKEYPELRRFAPAPLKFFLFSSSRHPGRIDKSSFQFPTVVRCMCVAVESHRKIDIYASAASVVSVITHSMISKVSCRFFPFFFSFLFFSLSFPLRKKDSRVRLASPSERDGCCVASQYLHARVLHVIWKIVYLYISLLSRVIRIVGSGALFSLRFR
jgi:hypothetical protein